MPMKETEHLQGNNQRTTLRTITVNGSLFVAVSDVVLYLTSNANHFRKQGGDTNVLMAELCEAMSQQLNDLEV